MCGGTLEINNETVATCEYCGTQQTLPKLNDDRRANLYDRANHFRRNNEFDKAMGIYEQILNEDNTDAEAYWSLVLCRYGIEYVEDPSSHKRIPTVNRAQFTSIFDDDNYKSALQYADGYQRNIYENEAKVINEIQKGILAISQKEEPFDVFICYKETDNNGRRTPDSVLANDLYHQLTQEGFKVFFSRITLEDKLGVAYEPYIFAALNSAKVMVVLGTKPEYFKAVWVKNEWSRYLALIKNGAKKTLIPAYRDMDPYDLPEEFSHLQAQDMSKLGFMQDLIRGIKKMLQETSGEREQERLQALKKSTPTDQNLEKLNSIPSCPENYENAFFVDYSLPPVKDQHNQFHQFIAYTYNGEDTIKYVYFYGYLCNAVEDPIGGMRSLKITGPLNKGNFSWKSWYWYDLQFSKFKLVAVVLEFMNGDIFKIDESYIVKGRLAISNNSDVFQAEFKPLIPEGEVRARKVDGKIHFKASKALSEINFIIYEKDKYGKCLGFFKPSLEAEDTSKIVDTPHSWTWTHECDFNTEYLEIICAYVLYQDGTLATYTKNNIKSFPATQNYTAQNSSTQNNSSGGCYIATSVYGSYDCPQVWTLRRFRDFTLAETWYGRAFIRTYYAISPTLVKWFGHTEWFKRMWKGKLDRMVANLNAEGVEDTPYEDKV